MLLYRFGVLHRVKILQQKVANYLQLHTAETVYQNWHQKLHCWKGRIYFSHCKCYDANVFKTIFVKLENLLRSKFIFK